MSPSTNSNTNTVRFSADAPLVMNDMPGYKLSKSLQETLWYSRPELAEMATLARDALTTKTASSKQQRRDFVQAVLAQQEEHREELGGAADEKGLRMIACALSKADQKKAIQLARQDALEAYAIHYSSAQAPLQKSMEEYSQRTCISGVKRRTTSARGA